MYEKIGQYLIRLEILSFDQAEEVIRIQNLNSNKKFGEIAVELGYITPLDLELYINDVMIK